MYVSGGYGSRFWFRAYADWGRYGKGALLPARETKVRPYEMDDNPVLEDALTVREP